MQTEKPEVFEIRYMSHEMYDQMNEQENLLEVENLQVNFHTLSGVVRAVRGVSFSVKKGETIAIVGESGCGKSVTAKSILRLLPSPPSETLEGSAIHFLGEDVLAFDKKRLSAYRGGETAIIFQDALAALNPTMTAGKQIAENLRHHKLLSRKEAMQEAAELLKRVGIPQSERRVRQYPHEFSGGMRQRVMIAIAFACSPRLLIADEPTTSLDVTIQAQIMSLIKKLQEETGTSVILITHDLGVVAGAARRILVMYAGKIVERGTSMDIFRRPAHPYTRALLSAVPRLDSGQKQVLTAIRGTPPDLIKPPQGCPFAPRCKYCMNICHRELPEVKDFGGQHFAQCWLYNLRSEMKASHPFFSERVGQL